MLKGCDWEAPRLGWLALPAAHPDLFGHLSVDTLRAETVVCVFLTPKIRPRCQDCGRRCPANVYGMNAFIRGPYASPGGADPLWAGVRSGA